MASGTASPDASACSAAARQPPQMSAIRPTVVGRAWERVYAASRRYVSCSAAVRSRHSQAARAMPMAQAVKGPADWVTMSAMACATSPWASQVT